jgi:VanZ family protein
MTGAVATRRQDHALAAAWALVVGVLLLLPAAAVPALPAWTPEPVGRGADELAHAALFFVAAWLLRRSFRHLARERRAIQAAAVAAIAYGAALELLQSSTGRDPAASDALANAAGVALYLVVALAGRRYTSPACMA